MPADSPFPPPTGPAWGLTPPTKPFPIPAPDHGPIADDRFTGDRASSPPAGRVSRRRFLAGAAGAGVAGAAALALTHRSWQRLVVSQPSAQSISTGKGILVMVTLYGGNDGLNTVIPYQDGAYLKGRPTLGYQPNQVLPLADGLALHPNLKGLKALWDAKQLAVVRGVGYPNPVLSHFRGMDIWQTGSPDEPVATGVMGRWLDSTGSDPMRAISIGSTLPRLLTGERSSGTAIAGATINIPGGAALAPALASLDAPGPDRTGLAAAVAQSGSDLLQVQHTLADLLAHPAAGAPAAAPGATGTGTAGAGAGAAGAAKGGAGKGSAAPKSGAGNGGAGKGGAGALAGDLDIVARLIKAGSPTRVYQVSMGGFDNHAQEKDAHARLMGELDTAISAFMNALQGSPQASSVVLMTYSEFGRRVVENLSGGTDHGTAAPLFVVGRAVRGGQFFGDEPSLTNLDSGNLKFTTDFRSVFATMLANVVGVDPKVALNGSFPTLKLL